MAVFQQFRPRGLSPQESPRERVTASGVARYLALAPRPTEPLLAQELRGLPGVSDIEERSGAVSFRGDRAALYRANLWLRCATRVLVPLRDAPCGGADDLYDAAADLPWEEYLAKTGTLMVSAHGVGPGLDNSVFTAQRVKDAVVDRFRARTGGRPSVDLRQPDLRIHVQLYQQDGVPRCALALDSSGAPLHQRGYRHSTGAAPLKETLAAALVALTGYGDEDDDAPFLPVVDLCCGSGTLLIEAGLRRLRQAPGLLRGFGFERWLHHDHGLWRALRKEAQQRARPLPSQPFLFGSDSDREAIRQSERNAEAAGIGAALRLQVQDLAQAAPPPGPPGMVICNLPYGERLMPADEAALLALYQALGDTLKQRFKGYTAYVFTANLPLSKHIGLRTQSRQVVCNGNLEGRLLRFDLY